MTRRVVLKSVVVAVVLSAVVHQARGEEAVSPPPPSMQSSSEEPIQWRAYLGGGLTAGAETEVTVKYQGQALGAGETKDKSSWGLSSEIEAQFHPVFSGSFLVEYSPFKNEDGSKDTQLAFLLMPKARTKFGLWVGIGAGLMNTSFDNTTEVDGTTRITYDDSSVMSFVFSPRVGFDHKISEGFTLGAFVSYTTGSDSLTASIVDTTLGLNDKLTADFERHWWTFVVRAGFDL